MKKVLVTGANGFIGKMLVNALVENGYKVVALDIPFEDVLLNNTSITCISVFDKAVADLKDDIPPDNYDYFLHLAWVGTSGLARADYIVQSNNIKASLNNIKLCKYFGYKRVIYASSINEMETYEYLQSDDIEPSLPAVSYYGGIAA